MTPLIPRRFSGRIIHSVGDNLAFVFASFSIVADNRGRFSKFREEGCDFDDLDRGIFLLPKAFWRKSSRSLSNFREPSINIDAWSKDKSAQG